MTTQQPSNPGLSSQRSGSEIQAIGAVAGMIGPILFTVGFVVQGLFRRGEYDPIAETVSALEAGPNGWVQQLNFLVFATLMMIFGAGLGSGLRTGRRSIGSAVVVFWGVGLLGAGLFPLREDFAGQTYDPTGVHQPIGAVFFLSTWVGLAVLSLVLATRASLAGSGPIHTAHEWDVGGPVSRYGRSRDLVFSSVASMGRSHPTSRVGGVVSVPYCARGSTTPGKPVPIGHAGCRAHGVGRLDSRFVEIGKDVGNRFIRGLATAVKPVANLGSLPSQHLVQGSG
jgi:hypothetical protein